MFIFLLQNFYKIAAFIFSMALAFIPASMITFTVKERED